MKRGFVIIEMVVVTALTAALAAVIFPVIADSREKAREVVCISNSREICVDILIWSQDNNEKLPTPAQVWKTGQITSDILVCPTRGKEVANAYGYNRLMSHVDEGNIDIPDEAVLTADWNDLGPNAAANPNIIVSKDNIAMRHRGGAVYSFCDGHVAWSDGKVNDKPTMTSRKNSDPNIIYLAPKLVGKAGG